MFVLQPLQEALVDYYCLLSLHKRKNSVKVNLIPEKFEDRADLLAFALTLCLVFVEG
jgi:hypothetical protein